MTPFVLSSEDFAALGAPDLVYVRPVKAAEIMADTPVDQVRGFDIEPNQTLYAVHRADGARLAVKGDKESAVAIAQRFQSDLQRHFQADLSTDATQTISATVGIAAAPQDGKEPGTLVKAADRRLYVDRKAGARSGLAWRGVIEHFD